MIWKRIITTVAIHHHLLHLHIFERVEHVIEWNDDNCNILLINEVLLEANGVIFDDYDHFLIDDPVIDPQEDGDLNTHDPDMWLYQMNGKNNSLYINY